VNPLQPALGGFSNAFIAKVSADGASLVYSTYLGGSSLDQGLGIAVDSSGSAYVTGTTGSRNFPLVNPLQPIYGGGTADAFIAKVSADGASLVYSTYLGGDDDEYGAHIAVDSLGTAYIVGFTKSPNFPTTERAFARTCGTDGRCNEVFVCDEYGDNCHFERVADAFVARIEN
jgi:hypothetical protein